MARTLATLVEHPLLRHKITHMRNPKCSTSKFRRLMNEVSLIMAVEVTRDLSTEWGAVRRSEDHEGQLLTGPKPIIVVVLRAGLGMADAFLEIMPSALVGHLGLHKDRDHLIQHLIALPETEKEGHQRNCFIIDPVIGTGNVASRAIAIMKSEGVSASNIHYVTIVAAPEGLAKLSEDHPDVRIYCADKAERLNENMEIVPGWGDATNKLFGIK